MMAKANDRHSRQWVLDLREWNVAAFFSVVFDAADIVARCLLTNSTTGISRRAILRSGDKRHLTVTVSAACSGLRVSPTITSIALAACWTGKYNPVFFCLYYSLHDSKHDTV